MQVKKEKEWIMGCHRSLVDGWGSSSTCWCKK
jgi:hypothetical protein